MAKVSTNISIDADIKKQAQELFAELGMDLSSAINVFLHQSVWEQGIPFLITRATPNLEIIRTMRESEYIKSNPDCYRYYKNFDEDIE